MATCVSQFVKYILCQYSCNFETFIGMISDKDIQGTTPEDRLEKIVRAELIDTAKTPFRDASLLHLHMLGMVLDRPFIQHCSRKAYEEYRAIIFPCGLSDEGLAEPEINLLWVPTKPSTYARISHIVPAIGKMGRYDTTLDVCPFRGLYTCLFVRGLHCREQSELIRCDHCGQWIHSRCLGFRIEKKKNFVCGCSKRPLHSLEWYSSKNISSEVNEMNLQEFSENVWIANGARMLTFRSCHRRNQEGLRYNISKSPLFDEDLVDQLLTNFVQRTKLSTEQEQLVPDVFLPELFISIIMDKESCNRLQAEHILRDSVEENSSY